MMVMTMMMHPELHVLLSISCCHPLTARLFSPPAPTFVVSKTVPLKYYNAVLLSNFPHLNLEKVLWRTVDLVKALLPRVWHGLHDGPVQIRRLAGRLRGVLIVRQFGGVIMVVAMA